MKTFLDLLTVHIRNDVSEGVTRVHNKTTDRFTAAILRVLVLCEKAGCKNN